MNNNDIIIFENVIYITNTPLKGVDCMLELYKAIEKEKGAIFNISWSPDSKYIALAIGGKDVLIRNIETGEIEKILKHKGFLTSIDKVVWSNNGDKIATAGYNELYIWDVKTLSQIYKFKEHKKEIKSITWMPSDKFVATGGEDKHLVLWDLEQGKLFGAVKLEGQIRELSWSPDSEKIGIALDKDFGLVVDAKKAIEERKLVGIKLKGHKYSLTSICWNPKSEKLATGSMDNTSIIWDAKSGNIIHVLKGHTGRFNSVSSVSWHPSGKYIATVSSDKTVRIWDAETGENVHVLNLKNTYESRVRWSPDGKYLAVTSHRDLLIYSLE